MMKMTKETLKEICKQKKLYIIPSHNDELYLQYGGMRKICLLPIVITIIYKYTLLIIWTESSPQMFI